MKVNYFNFCAVLILSALVLTTLARKMYRGRRNRFFIALLIEVLLCAVFDLWAVGLDNRSLTRPVASHLRLWSHSGYLLLHSLSTVLYLVYIIILTGTWHKFRNRRCRGLVFLPILAVGAVVAVNFFQPILFYFNGEGAYVRGLLFPLLYLCAGFYVAAGIACLTIYRKALERTQVVSLGLLFLFFVGSVAVQAFRPQYPIEMFAQSFGLMISLMLIQRPEEQIDIVTGLQRTRAFNTETRQAFLTGRKITIVLISVTNYNSLYDMLGHDRCHQMLRGIARRLAEMNRQSHFGAELYHFSNGQFGLLFNEKKREKAEQAAGRIHTAFRRLADINEMELQLLGNVCVLYCPEDIGNFEMLDSFRHDLVKKEYMGQVRYASDILKQGRYDLLQELDGIIERALAEHRFMIYYQPIYSVEEQNFHSAEALLRLQDEKYGFISPELFIPAAEKSGAIHRIGDYVLEEVCRFISSGEFQKLGMRYIEVNLSVAQCMQSDLAERILSILDKYRISPDKINLEITETAVSYAQQTMMDNIEKLTEAGIPFALDDFGTGYSNIYRMASLPLSIVKLDKEFTYISENPDLIIVLENTIKMLKDMKKKIVIEGIETTDMARQFTELQCEYIQGYYYSRPIPKAELITFLRKQREGTENR